MRVDGSGEVRLRAAIENERRPWLYPTWLLGGVANAIQMAGAFRSAAGAPTAEYALEWELIGSHGRVVLGPLWPNQPERSLGEEIRSGTVLPRLSIGGPDEWDALLQQVMEDLLAAAGVESLPGPYSADW
jgi:hypothetical protein